MLAFAPRPASATLEADPQMLYRQMKDAFARGDAHGWTYADQVYYLSTIFNAGRAYALQRPDDPAYGELATLTVQIGGALHYNPLIDYDAAAWYVREACRWVEKNSTDFALISASQALTERIDAEDNDPEALARMADEDALAIAHQFPHDVQAELMPLDADWRAWTLTHDTAWRTLAFERVAQPGFPIANLPDVFGAAFVDAAQGAVANAPGYSPADRANAAVIIARLKRIGKLDVIAHANAVPHDVYMSTLAPADEYFGPLGMSVLGIENEMKHVNVMLDYKYGNLESDAAVNIAMAVDDMHKVYPRDRDMAKLLLACIQMLERMTTPASTQEAGHLRGILTVEYQDSSQAQQLLGVEP
jgi:hypothetical protein